MSTFLRAFLLLCLASLGLGACTSGPCGDGRSVGDFCAYSTTSSIVIEGGFRCPADLPMQFEFGGAILCGPSGASLEDASSACASGGFECGPPSCDIAPERDDCVPMPGADAGAGFGPCDAGPIDFCREHIPEFGPGCCGDSVAPLCRIGGGGYGCPEGSIESTECTSCL